MKGVLCFAVLAVFAAAALKESDAAASSGGDASFLAMYKQHENSCQCVKQVCFCCILIPGLETRTCINYKQFLTSKKLKVDVSFEGLNALGASFPLAEKNQLCKPLPTAVSPGVTACLYQQNAKQKDGSTQSCHLLAFKTDAVGSLLNIKLKCLTLKTSGLSFDGNTQLTLKNQVFAAETSSNFKAVVNNLRKAGSVPTSQPEPQPKPVPQPAPKPIPAPAPAPTPAPNKLQITGNFNALYKKYNNQCKCVKQTCLCCFPIPLIGMKTCYSHQQIPAEHNLRLKLVVEGLPVMDETFLISPQFQKCGILSAKLLSLNACITSSSDPSSDGSMRSCTSIGLAAGGGALSGIKLTCINMLPTGLSYGGKTEIAGAQVLTSWANPKFVAAINKIKS